MTTQLYLTPKDRGRTLSLEEFESAARSKVITMNSLMGNSKCRQSPISRMRICGTGCGIVCATMRASIPTSLTT